MKKQLKYIFTTLLILSFFFVLTACSSAKEPTQQKSEVSVAVLKGPTGIGAVELMQAAQQNTSINDYTFQVIATPDEAMAKLIQGEVDIAALPTNVASTVYNKSEQEIAVAAINTLGTLSILEKGDTIHSISDLEGKTIYVSGQGAVPEYALQYLLEKNNLKNVTVNYMTEHAELAAALLSGDVNIALLPEPNVTAVLSKDTSIRKALDLTQQWSQIESNAQLAMGCIAVRKDFMQNNAAAFQNFLTEYQSSVEFVNKNVSDASVLVEQYGIMDSATVAQKAIPNCNIVFISGEEMKTALENFYQILFTANPKSIGGSLPNEDFYYTK